MADSTEEEQTEVETVEVDAPGAPRTFWLKSVVRGRANRTQRAVQPGRMPFVQRFAGGTIMVRRARPARITEAALLANIVEITKAVRQHKVIVTDMSGRVLSLDILESAPAPAEKPMPNPPLDSANNDKNQNIGYDVPPTPEGTTMSAPEPELLKGTQTEETAPMDEPPHPPPPGPFPTDIPVPDQAPEEMASETPEALPSTSSETSHGKHKGKGKRG